MCLTSFALRLPNPFAQQQCDCGHTPRLCTMGCDIALTNNLNYVTNAYAHAHATAMPMRTGDQNSPARR